MTWLPAIGVTKSGDLITIMIRQRYKARGKDYRADGTKAKMSYRWRIAGQVSLKELEREELREEGKTDDR